MRINIEVPHHSTTTASTSQVQLTNVPPTIAKLTPSGELVLIELQGSLEIDDAHTEGGQVLGKLEFHSGREERPTLLISHHRLEGKLVSLTKPFAVLQKRKKVSDTSVELNRGNRAVMKDIQLNNTVVNSEKKQRAMQLDSSPMRLGQTSRGKNVEDKREEGDEEDDGGAGYLDEEDGTMSPSMARKRARICTLDSNGPQTPTKAIKRGAATTVSSSSPAPRAPMRGSELDFSSPISTIKRQASNGITQHPEEPSNVDDNNDDDDGGEDWLHKKSTATYFDVICIIRKKILFTKRPEPVVRLDGEGGEKARLALGLA